MNTHEWDHAPRNAEWYAEYEARFARFLAREEIDALSIGHHECPTCQVPWDDVGHCPKCDAEAAEVDEPHFSWKPCEGCGSRLGGERHRATGWHNQSQMVVTFEVCADCAYYASFGRLDDVTMEIVGGAR